MSFTWGTPPRMREKHIGQHLGDVYIGNTPAYAEKTLRHQRVYRV